MKFDTKVILHMARFYKKTMKMSVKEAVSAAVQCHMLVKEMETVTRDIEKMRRGL